MRNRVDLGKLRALFSMRTGASLLGTSLVVGLLTLPSCGKKAGEVSSLDDLAFDSDANNVALIFGAQNGLKGVATDVREMSRVLSDSSYGFSFKTESNVDASKKTILDSIKSKAATVGDRGTLALYFSGHGTKDGRFVTTQGYLGFNEVTNAIKAGRNGRPVKRVIVFNDSCYSGNWIDSSEGMTGSSLLGDSSEDASKGRGSVELSEKDGDKLAESSVGAISKSMQGENRGNEVFEQLLIMSAARDSETSLDLGVSNGGAFTYALRKTLMQLKSRNSSAKLKDMVQSTVQLTQDNFRHIPQFNVSPAIMMEGALFGRTPQVAAVPVTDSSDNATTPVANSSENAHVAAVLGLINEQLSLCEIKVDEIASKVNSDGWYRALLHADYTSGSSSAKYYGWVNLRSTIEDEAKRILKVIPGSYFPGCKRVLPTSSTVAFAEESGHFAKTLSTLNAKLDCKVKLDKMTSGKDGKGIYRFLFSATYADGSKSEQRASWGQVSASAEDEAKAFLEAIPSRYFSQCKQM